MNAGSNSLICFLRGVDPVLLRSEDPAFGERLVGAEIGDHEWKGLGGELTG